MPAPPADKRVSRLSSAAGLSGTMVGTVRSVVTVQGNFGAAVGLKAGSRSCYTGASPEETPWFLPDILIASESPRGGRR
jgi:hypothetical protein